LQEEETCKPFFFCFQFVFRQVIYKQIMKVDIANTVLELLDSDITEMDTDAIVNAANSMLIMGGGVAGAIRRKGGLAIQMECLKIGKTKVGEAVITTAGKLKAKYVIHAVGPRMGEGDEDEKLKNATLNSLKLADKHNLEAIAFPAISAGIFGFPIDRCAEIMLRTTIDYLNGFDKLTTKAKTGLKKVVFCLFGKESYAVFERQLGREIAQ
jgi:O-acetyl-ADP-ribose deacetylase (regulator of RNase III)